MGTLEYWERQYDRLFLKRLVPSLLAFEPMMPLGIPSEKNKADRSDDNGGDGMSQDEVDFLDLAKEMGLPLKKIQFEE